VGEEPEVKILFVCSGNICRSPMAAACMRERAAARGLVDLVVDSAGTLGLEGERAAPEAVRALAEVGIDLSNHRSRGLVTSDLTSSDLILVMTREHLRDVIQRHAACAPRLHLLRAFENGVDPRPDSADLFDPMGAPYEIYRNQVPLLLRCADQLSLYLGKTREPTRG
jgi:protein-tyrosine phosphatase